MRLTRLIGIKCDKAEKRSTGLRHYDIAALPDGLSPPDFATLQS